MASYLTLESGAGRLLLESGSLLLLESSSSVVDNLGTDALTVSDTGVVVAAWVDSESLTLGDTGMLNFPIVLTDTGAVSAIALGVDALAISESGVVLASWVAQDSPTLSEAVAISGTTVTADTITYTEQGSNAALLTASDAVALAEAGEVTEQAAGTFIVDTDAVVVAEVEALLASLDESDTLTVGEAALREPPDPSTPPVERPPGIYVESRRFATITVPPGDGSEDVLLAAYVGWYD